jgi:tRNA pseudouridine38-40 synthase
MRYLITFSYDGTNFNGYQRQDGLRTIQEEMEKALKIINDGIDTTLNSSGRTDKGVHALCQKAHVDMKVDITPYKLKRAMNSFLPEDIHVINTEVVDDNFHARYMVKEKEYQYKLNMGEYNPIDRNYVYQYCNKLNVEKMKEAINYFVGTHDFKSFTPTKDKRENYVRTINYVSIKEKDDILTFTFRGNGFIKYQIRNMVGYLIRVGEGKKKGEDIPKILDSKDRRMASITAHSNGLYLTKVTY